MSKIHVLDGGTNGVYRVVVHAPTPVGNNAAGILWSDAIKNSGRAISVLEVGTGPGQITTPELNQVQAGTVIEGTFVWGDNPAWTNQQRQDDLDLRAGQLINDLLARYGAELRYFGFIRT